MRPQPMRTKLNLKLFAARRVDAKEVNTVGVADGITVVSAFVDEGSEDGPLDGSPTRNISPPIGRLRPTLFRNRVVLKFLRIGTGTF